MREGKETPQAPSDHEKPLKINDNKILKVLFQAIFKKNSMQNRLKPSIFVSIIFLSYCFFNTLIPLNGTRGVTNFLVRMFAGFKGGLLIYKKFLTNY
jgi:hypothetical protein